MARKNATATDAKANAETVSMDATVAADAPKKNDAKRKRTDEAPKAPASKTAPAPKKAKTEDVDDEHSKDLVRIYDNSVHITNLPTTTVKEDLTKHFASVGGFVHVLVFHKKSRFGRPPSCSAQIEFSSPQHVAKALEKNGTLIEGLNIKVQAAHPPPAPIPHDTLRFLNIDTAVTEQNLRDALAKWADHIVKVTVPLAEDGVSNRGFAFVKFKNVGWSTEVFTSFKTPLNGSVATIYYQKTNPQSTNPQNHQRKSPNNIDGNNRNNNQAGNRNNNQAGARGGRGGRGGARGGRGGRTN